MGSCTCISLILGVRDFFGWESTIGTLLKLLKLIKLFQTICMGVGMVVIAMLMSQFYRDWRENPIQTTVQSMAIPVAPVPFPAVTVCDDNIPLDPWAYVEKVSNLLEFECTRGRARSEYVDCSRMDHRLRTDFSPFLDFVADKAIEVLGARRSELVDFNPLLTTQRPGIELSTTTLPWQRKWWDNQTSTM